MPEILDARIRYKTDTEANWMANPLLLLSGEPAFVINDDGQFVNLKIGATTEDKTFAELNYMIDYAEFGASILEPIGDGETLPDPGPDAARYMVLGPGTYDKPGGGDIEVPEETLGILFWNGTDWSLGSTVDVGVDLSAYALETVGDKSVVRGTDGKVGRDELSTTVFNDLYVEQYLGQLFAQGSNYTNGALKASDGSTLSGAYNSTYRRTGQGTTSTFIVQTGKIHYYTGEIAVETDAVAGVVYRDASGLFISSECLSGGSGTVYSRYKLTVPPNAVYIAACTKGVSPTNPIIEYGQLVSKADGNGNAMLYVDKNSASGTEDGSFINPFKTIAAAINLIANNSGGRIVVRAGDYRETLPFEKIKFGTVEIIAMLGEKVRILGSNAITGWTKTGGYTNVYEAPFVESIPVWSRYGAQIFEDGNQSRAILAAEKEPEQKGYSHRLPFTPINLVSDIATVDATPSSYHVTGGKIYIRTTNSTNPASNGFSYENIVRAANTYQSPTGTPNKGSLILSEIRFLYTLTGVQFIGLERVTRYNCSSLASAAGKCFGDDTPKVVSYGDEVGYCDVDGINGHFNAYAGYASLGQRESKGLGIYHNLWSHDCGDDGVSHHERHDAIFYGGLSEYNGDGGFVGSNSGNYTWHGSKARKNGQRVPGEVGALGEGFTVRVGTLDTLNDGKATAVGCIADSNNFGFAGTVAAINCHSYNSVTMEYQCTSVANCFATNANPAKYKHASTVVKNGVLVI